MAISIVQTSDGGCALAGSTKDQPSKFWVAKIVSGEEPPTGTSPPITPTPDLEPQQRIPIEAIVDAAIMVAVIVAGLGLLIYLIKSK